jgi:(E)-4-hydroxy-3-methylbut-2-enyl-diphosphate synthase
LGIAAGRGKGHLFVKGENVAVVPEADMVSALVEWAELIHEHGIDAALERARATRATARKAAESDRQALLEAKGDDANRSESRIQRIRSLRD